MGGIGAFPAFGGALGRSTHPLGAARCLLPAACVAITFTTPGLLFWCYLNGCVSLSPPPARLFVAPPGAGGARLLRASVMCFSPALAAAPAPLSRRMLKDGHSRSRCGVPPAPPAVRAPLALPVRPRRGPRAPALPRRVPGPIPRTPVRSGGCSLGALACAPSVRPPDPAQRAVPSRRCFPMLGLSRSGGHPLREGFFRVVHRPRPPASRRALARLLVLSPPLLWWSPPSFPARPIRGFTPVHAAPSLLCRLCGLPRAGRPRRLPSLARDWPPVTVRRSLSLSASPCCLGSPPVLSRPPLARLGPCLPARWAAARGIPPTRSSR